MFGNRYIKGVGAGAEPPLKVYYNRCVFNNLTYYIDGDERYWRDNGINNYISSPPSNAVLQRLDPFADDKLWYFNKWGHKWRFTSSNGGYWDNVANQWKDKFGTVTTQALCFPPISGGTALISDLFSGLMWSNDMTATNYKWNNVLATSLSYSEGGFTDWFVPNQGTAAQLCGGQDLFNKGLWSTNRKPFVGWDRAAMWTCSTYRVGTGTQAMRAFVYGNIDGFTKTNNANMALCRQENNDFVIQP